MPNPTITVNGNYYSLTGATTGYVTATLSGFGSNVPTLAGTGIVVSPTVTTAVGSSFSLVLYGNDVIVPPNTFYLFTFYDAFGNKLSTAQYQFAGTGAIDLSTYTPMMTNPAPYQGTPIVTNPTGPQVLNGALTIKGAISATSYNGTVQGETFTTPQAAIDSLGSGGGVVHFAPGSYPAPTSIPSGVQLIADTPLAPAVMWEEFNGVAFRSFLAPPTTVEQVVFQCTAPLTLADSSRIGITNIVFDMQNCGGMTIKGVSSSYFKFAVVNAPATTVALTIKGDATLDSNGFPFNSCDNTFDELYVHGGSTGLQIGCPTSETETAITESQFNFIRIFTNVQPTGTYTALAFAGQCDSVNFKRVSFWYSSAVTSINGVVFNSSSTTADQDADGITIDWYDETGQGYIGSSIVVNPSANNYIRTGVLSGSIPITYTTWSGNSTLKWERLTSGGLPNQYGQITTTPNVTIDAGRTGTPSLCFNRTGTQLWQNYSGSLGELNWWNTAAAKNVATLNPNGQLVLNDSVDFYPLTINAPATGGGITYLLGGNTAWDTFASPDGTFHISNGTDKVILNPTVANFYTPIGAPVVNGVVSADQFTAVPVSAPTFVAGAVGLATGGTVAAGSYRCVVTYNGSTGGETTASGASWPSVTTTGSTSSLMGFANDAPAGAISYNTYWQTGGTGNYYKATSNVAFGLPSVLTTTPPTSGATPPTTNTATGVLAGAQAYMNGGHGAWIVPSYAPAGNPGDPAVGQTLFDFRTGAISSRQTTGSPQKGMTGSVMNYGFNLDMQAPELVNGQQVNGVSASIEQGDFSRYGTALPDIPCTCAGFFRNYRFGTSHNGVWGANSVAYVENQNAQAYALELDVYNNSTSPATSDNGGTGIILLSAGNQPTWNAIEIGHAGAGKWACGISIDGPSVVNDGVLIGTGITNGLRSLSPVAIQNLTPATAGANQPSPSFTMLSSAWNGSASVADYWTLAPAMNASGVPTYEVLALTNTGSPTTNLAFQIPNKLIIQNGGNSSWISSNATAVNTNFNLPATSISTTLAVLDVPQTWTVSPTFPGVGVVATALKAVTVDVYAAALSGLAMQMRAARGTPSLPTAVQNNDYLGGFSTMGYGATGFPTGWRAALIAQAAESWSDTAQGTKVKIGVTAPGTAAQAGGLLITSSGCGFQTITSPLTAIHLPMAAVVGWDNGSGTPDIGLSRIGPATAAVGNGTAGDYSGTLKVATVNATSGLQINGLALASTNLSDSASLIKVGSRIDKVSVGLWNGGAAIPAGTYTINARGLNIFGVTYTITAVRAYTDAGAPTVNVADNTANALLTGAITATSSWASGTQSGHTTIPSLGWTNWTIVADGTATTINAVMTITY